jgi:hypothetical protein
LPFEGIHPDKLEKKFPAPAACMRMARQNMDVGQFWVAHKRNKFEFLPYESKIARLAFEKKIELFF